MALERRCELAAGFAQRVGLQVTFGGNGSYIYLHLPTRIHAFLWVQICIRSCVFFKSGSVRCGCLLLEGEAQQNKRTEDEYVRLYSAYKVTSKR